MKMAILAMPKRIQAEVAKLTITIEEKMLIRRRNMVKHRQDSNIDESDESDDEEHFKPKKEEAKYGLTHVEEVYIIRIIIMKGISQRNVSF